MAEYQGGERRSVKLPVIGNTKRQYVVAGGALIVGIVGYAYWQRGRQTSPNGEVLPEDIPQDRQPPPTVVGTEDFTSEETRAIINTNAEWYTAAVEYLSTTGGYDFIFVTTTLGKFLARRELSESEANLVQAAKGAVGEPPLGGPWPVIRGSAGTVTGTGLSAPVVAARKVNRVTVRISWSAVSGATGYEIRRIRGGTPGTGEAWRNVGILRSYTSVARPTRPTLFAWGVRAVKTGVKGPEARTQSIKLG